MDPPAEEKREKGHKKIKPFKEITTGHFVSSLSGMQRLHRIEDVFTSFVRNLGCDTTAKGLDSPPMPQAYHITEPPRCFSRDAVHPESSMTYPCREPARI